MNRIVCSTLLAAAAALAGCDQSDHTISAGPYDPQANAANAGVTLPPAIAASRAYRCRDNSLVYVDWYSDGSARVKSAPNEAGTHVPPPAAPAAPDANATADAPPAPPVLEGSVDSASITYAGKTCRR